MCLFSLQKKEGSSLSLPPKLKGGFYFEQRCHLGYWTSLTLWESYINAK